MPKRASSPIDQADAEAGCTVDDMVDDPAYRAAILTGRAGALEEIAILMKRLSLSAKSKADVETTLDKLVSNWFEMASWLAQATSEAADELTLLRNET